MKKALLVCFALIFSLAWTSPEASAGSPLGGLSLTPASSNTEVGMVFYKMVGARPDFDSWITSEPRYLTAAPEQRAEILAEERRKLEIAFNALDVRKSPLVIRTAVKLQISAPSGQAKRTLEVKFPAEGDIYFPYKVANQNITIIPNGVDLYRHIPLSNTEAASIQGRLAYNGSATMVLEIIPVKADGAAPMKLDGVDQWLMMGEIGFIGLYNNSLEVIWSYQAPWFTRKNRQDLFSLYGNARPQSGEPEE